MTFHYQRLELDRLGVHEYYKVKFVSDTGETKWLSIDVELMGRLRAAIIQATMPEVEGKGEE